MLARAVVADPRRPRVARPRAGRAAAPGRSRARSSRSPQAASTSATTATWAGDPPCDAHASARWRVAEPEALEHAGAHAAERLQRLDRRAREHRQLRVWPAHGAVGVHDAPGDAVLGLDRTAPDRDDARQERAPASAPGSPRSAAARARARTSRRRRPPCPRAACRSRRSARSRSAAGRAGRRARAAPLQFGSSCGTQRILSSWPLSSVMRKTAIAVTGIRQPRERRLGDADHRVERVAVLAERVGDEAVVGRIDDRGEQEAVELDAAERLVPLVLVARPLRDLDEAMEGFVHAVRTIVSEMLKGFRDFVMRGNVVDLAIAVIIGAAFGAVVARVRDRLRRRPARRARRHARLRRRRRDRQRLEDRLRLDAQGADPVPDRRGRHLLRRSSSRSRGWPSGAARRRASRPRRPTRRSC